MKKLILISCSMFYLFAGHVKSNDLGLKLLNEGDRIGAMNVWKKECKEGNGWACGNVAIMYYKGLGVKKDVTLAKKFFNKGCQLNDIGSCATLGEIAYAEQNLPAAKGYFSKVCKMGKYVKGVIYSKRDIVENCRRAESIK